MTVLVTGGAGYIGSHTCVELLEKGMDVVVIDNLVNSSAKAIDRIEEITGKKVTFYEEDVRNRAALASRRQDTLLHRLPEGRSRLGRVGAGRVLRQGQAPRDRLQPVLLAGWIVHSLRSRR